MVILGVDYGSRRVGLAITDSEEIIATPLKTLQVRDAHDAARKVAEVARARQVALIVVGLPLNMNGSVGPKAAEIQAFVSIVQQQVPCQVLTWDERLSTVTAEDALLEAGLTRKKRRQRIDKVAAQVILSDFLQTWHRE